MKVVTEFFKTGFVRIPGKFTRKKILDICKQFGTLLPTKNISDGLYKPNKEIIKYDGIHAVGYSEDKPWGATLPWHQDGIYHHENFWGIALYPFHNSGIITTKFTNLRKTLKSLPKNTLDEARQISIEFGDPAEKFSEWSNSGMYKNVSKHSLTKKTFPLISKHIVTGEDILMICPFGIVDESFFDHDVFKEIIKQSQNYIKEIKWQDHSGLLLNDNLTWMHMTEKSDTFCKTDQRIMWRVGFNYDLCKTTYNNMH